MTYPRAKETKTFQEYRFQKLVNKIGEYLLERAQKVLKFIHYGVSYTEALVEVLSMSRKLGVNIVTRKSYDKKHVLVGIQIIPV